MTIPLKTPAEIELIRQSARIGVEAMEVALATVRSGVTTLELNQVAEEQILKAGAKPSFQGFKGYPYATCIDVNEGLVHGMPDDYVLQEGDLVSVDLGSFWQGWHSDLARTVEVGSKNQHQQFLEVGRQALKRAVTQCQRGGHIGDISAAIEQVVEDAGYRVTEHYVGHGIGKELHEEPQIPCFVGPDRGPELRAGMVLAIEVMYMAGNPETVVDEDGWTVRTRDGQLAALFEDTVAVTERGGENLTGAGRSSSPSS